MMGDECVGCQHKRANIVFVKLKKESQRFGAVCESAFKERGKRFLVVVPIGDWSSSSTVKANHVMYKETETLVKTLGLEFKRALELDPSTHFAAMVMDKPEGQDKVKICMRVVQISTHPPEDPLLGLPASS